MYFVVAVERRKEKENEPTMGTSSHSRQRYAHYAREKRHGDTPREREDKKFSTTYRHLMCHHKGICA